MRIDKVMEAAVSSAKTYAGARAVEEVQFANNYAEPGYDCDNNGVAFGNWNTITKYNKQTGQFETLDDVMSRLCNVLEKMNYEIEWNDEWTFCSNCGAAVRTSPDSYEWQPSYVENDGEVNCLDCLDAEEHLEKLENNERVCNQVSQIDPSEHGYMLIENNFEHGFHHGMDADPKQIAKLLRKVGATRFLFNQECQYQFYTVFAVYLHEDESEILEPCKRALQTGETDGPSVSGNLKLALQNAAAQQAEMKKDRSSTSDVLVSKVNSDGTATTKIVSAEDFVAGRALDD